MRKQGRFLKTPERNLLDLDDHLYFLKDDLAKCIGGDYAYAKKIAAELRTLVCLSSGTEGLLWRVVEQLKADDRLDLQATTGVNKGHPLVKSLSFLLVPVFRAGQGPAAFHAKRISLRSFIKEYEALYYNGESYTHEKLISSIAQQMGLSHESEDVAPHLIDMSGMAFSNRPALVEFLISDAEFTLDVGERVLQLAVSEYGFLRQQRPAITLPLRKVAPFHFAEEEHFEGRDQDISNKGTQFWVIKPPVSDWEHDWKFYNLGSLTFGKIIAQAFKHIDNTIEVSIYGIGNLAYMKRAPIRTRGKSEIVIVFVWNEQGCKIYIDGD